jgi:glycosyltransferase involved in cell wall biosynthesis
MHSTRIGVIVSHPIQHFCPQYTSWAGLSAVELKVFFASDHGLVPYADKGFGRVVQWDGIKLAFPHEFLPGAAGKALEPDIDSKELADCLLRFAPDILVIYGYSQALQRRALDWARHQGVRTLMISDSVLRSPQHWMKRALKAILLPHIYKRVTLFLTAGDANEAYYRKYGVRDDKVVRCSFPIDVAHYDAIMARYDECRKRIRGQLKLPAHHKVIMMVGKLVSWKRQIDLVRLSNAIQDEGGDVTVVLVGTGPDEDTLRSKSRRSGGGGVVFAGFVSPEVLAEYYCAADVYVHCSEKEPHSLAISEAIYCGLPVVLSDRCGSYGPTDDVRPGVNGFVYRCGDVAEMLRRVKYLIENGDSHAKMSRESQRISRQHQTLAHGVALTQALAIIESSAI